MTISSAPPGHIRILILSPATDQKSDIYSSFEVVCLGPDCPAYEALSYTWGANSRGDKVLINGAKLRILRNLDAALRYLRLEKEPQRLWADAVCINQKDNVEETQQVQQMRDVYSHASRVLVWLGEPDRDTDRAMEYLVSEPTCDEADKPLVGLEKLLNHLWWSRMWVVQEVKATKASPLIVCGDKTALWDNVCATLMRIAFDEMDRRKTYLNNLRLIFDFYTACFQC